MQLFFYAFSFTFQANGCFRFDDDRTNLGSRTSNFLLVTWRGHRMSLITLRKSNGIRNGKGNALPYPSLVLHVHSERKTCKCFVLSFHTVISNPNSPFPFLWGCRPSGSFYTEPFFYVKNHTICICFCY